jgi:hypothetical protein
MSGHRLLGIGIFAAACGPSPVGTWQGVVGLDADDGSTYNNDMTVADDGTAAITLYSLIEDTTRDGATELLIGESTFTATWFDASDVTFQLACDWEDCDFELAMTCTYTEEGMSCDATPDFYADDASVLQWVPVG